MDRLLGWSYKGDDWLNTSSSQVASLVLASSRIPGTSDSTLYKYYHTVAAVSFTRQQQCQYIDVCC